MSRQTLSVAVPWSLSHYISLNGFLPAYRALFEGRPKEISIAAWDNIELSQLLRGNNALRTELLNTVSSQYKAFSAKISSDLAAAYSAAYFPPNIALTSLLPGDIEFHHTSPFPSLTRPFIFHCESLAPIFFPFAHQDMRETNFSEALRIHYRRIFEDPLCLGIFSHLPETLRDMSHFFDSSEIDKKLHQSRIGLSKQLLPEAVHEKQWPLSTPRFLFVNSDNQNPANFFQCGGHVVLRFWKELRAAGHQGKLYLRSARPSDEALSAYGVDVAFLRGEECRSVIWIQEYLTNHELNALMADVHFLLLPSAALDSIPIMQSMALGTLPVVSDMIGTSLYVTNQHNGIVLEGVLSADWVLGPATGASAGNDRCNKTLDDSLVTQMTRQIIALLDAPHAYELLRQNALSCAQNQFSGSRFNDEFWATVQTLYSERNKKTCRRLTRPATIAALDRAVIQPNDWPRVFESTPQPAKRIYSGLGQVTELGGGFIHTIGCPSMDQHDWSVLAEYCKDNAPQLTYAKNIKELGGRYMLLSGEALLEERSRSIVNWVSRLLIPFPSIHRWAARVLKETRRLARLTENRLGSKIQPDIQLVLQGVSGMNVIRLFDKYYAIPLHEDEFSISKADAGGYSACIVGNSVKEVLRKIPENVAPVQAGSCEKNKSNELVELIEEGVHGFNIIRFADCFYAIPQSEGAFEYDRVLAGGYDRICSRNSIAAIKAAIKSRSI